MSAIVFAMLWKWMRGGFIVALALGTGYADACAPVRSRAVKAEFARAHPCPSTGLPIPSCAGWILDHPLARCAGGPDTAKNIQWSPLAESQAKDQEEFALCRMVRKGLVKKSTSRTKMCAVAQRENWPLTAAALCPVQK